MGTEASFQLYSVDGKTVGASNPPPGLLVRRCCFTTFTDWSQPGSNGAFCAHRIDAVDDFYDARLLCGAPNLSYRKGAGGVDAGLYLVYSQLVRLPS